jgi:hypothetical protein
MTERSLTIDEDAQRPGERAPGASTDQEKLGRSPTLLLGRTGAQSIIGNTHAGREGDTESEDIAVDIMFLGM